MRRETAAISPVTEVVAAIRAGEIVILVDDEDRENEGDLMFAAEFVTPEKINFLAKHGRGLVCMSVTEEHAARLGLKPMVEQNRSRHGTNFTVSIEAAAVTPGSVRIRARASAKNWLRWASVRYRVCGRLTTSVPPRLT